MEMRNDSLDFVEIFEGFWWNLAKMSNKIEQKILIYWTKNSDKFMGKHRKLFWKMEEITQEDFEDVLEIFMEKL